MLEIHLQRGGMLGNQFKLNEVKSVQDPSDPVIFQDGNIEYAFIYISL